MLTVGKYVDKFSSFMAALVQDGGPSSTRWVFLRTAEVISAGWLMLVGSVIFVFVHNPHPDALIFGAMTGVVLTLGAGLFAFAQQAQTTKLALDSKGNGTVTNTPLSSEVKAPETPPTT